MYKLLIVDDEPLVQIGIKSMLDWAKSGIEVAGIAPNGQVALKLIEEQAPDIVITDLKMPVMGGLELIRICREKYGGDRPMFIILTSYEDFHMVKEAITYQVTDYLVKLELTPESLTEAVGRVVERLRQSESRKVSANDIVHAFYEKFFIRLLNNLFESEEQFRLQSRELNLDLDYRGFVCCYGEMSSPRADDPENTLSMEVQLSLFSASMQMLKELAGKYCRTYGLSLDTRHFALIFCFGAAEMEKESRFWIPLLKNAMGSINQALIGYYNVSFRCAMGNLVENPLSICDSYQLSRQTLLNSVSPEPVLFYEEHGAPGASGHTSFNIGLFKEDLTKAFEEYDSETLRRTLDALCELFLSHPGHYVQVLDGVCGILYLSISLLQDGEQIVSGFFADNPDGYRSVYKQTNVGQLVNWLSFFERQLCQLFESHRKDHKNHIVTDVKKYINEHLDRRLSLNETAAVFGISTNYLSQLFGKYNDMGFSEYINTCKVKEARRLLDEGLKVYEVADMLGFESSFYFSKVFKKLEGVSPTEYANGK